MKVAVIGAGIIGVTTAFELGRDGHEVTVFERRGAAAEEASFANAGVIAPGYVTPWAAPGMPGKVLAQLLRRHASMRFAMPLGMAEVAWLWRWYRACRLDVYRNNRTRLQALAFYSRQRLHAITDQLRLSYDRSDGYLVLLRSERDRALVEPGLQVLRDAGVKFALVDADQVRRLEPGLNPETRLHAAIQLPEDEVANCRQFALLLKAEAQRQGVQFQFNTSVASLQAAGGVTVAFEGSAPAQRFDAAVVCAGVASAALLQPLGVHIPLVAVHGYSISAAIREPLNAPRSAVMDEHYKVAITRLGQRVRVAGGAELGVTRPSSGPVRCARSTRCCRTGSRVPPAMPRGCRNGKVLARCCPMARRWSEPVASRGCGSTWATAPAAGRWPAVLRGHWPTWCSGTHRSSTWAGLHSNASPPDACRGARPRSLTQ